MSGIATWDNKTDNEKEAIAHSVFNEIRRLFDTKEYDIDLEVIHLSQVEPYSGECDRNHHYFRCTIRLFMANIHSREKLEKVMIHEFVHLCMADMDWYADTFDFGKEELRTKFRENATTKLERTIYHLYKLLKLKEGEDMCQN